MKFNKYIVSKDNKTGMFYAHHRVFPNIPVGGSISEKRSISAEYAKMMNYLPNRVEEIEKARHEAFLKEYDLQ